MTDFQEAVWQFMRTVPPGKVVSYSDVARAVGCDHGAQAVGKALNRCPPDVPWWRVVRKDGGLIDVRESRKSSEHRDVHVQYAQIALLIMEGVEISMKVPRKRWWRP